MDADIFLSLNHFKGHEMTGFGGAIKNIGMGCGSRAGKMEMHNDGKPEVIEDACVGCRMCARFCAHSAIEYRGEGKAVKAHINHDRCVGCGRCIGSCNFHAIENFMASANDILNCKMAEYAKAVLDGRPHFHISVVNQVSPFCDCHGGERRGGGGPISASSPPSIRWRSIRPASTRSTPPRPSRRASSASGSGAITTTSPTSTRRPIGARSSIMPKRSALAGRNMS